MNVPALRVVLAQPRAFCAGVERVIGIVERALERFGPPVYVRHEIVHNKHVVETLKSKGARFVNEVDEIPKGSVAVFSAHGIAEAVPPELLVQDLTSKLGERYAVQIEVLAGIEENVHFRLPPELAERGVPAARDRPRVQ